jgi:hypothetical protein
MDREQLRELTNEELDHVAGGIIAVLLTGKDALNFHANSPNTEAAENGLSPDKQNDGAHVVFRKSGP